MGKTEIEWTHRTGTVGRTWNVAQGCARKSTGCENCYAERTAARFAKDGWSKGLINLRTRKWSGDVRLAAHKLAEPLSWRDPSTVFTNSMSDLFHAGFTNEEIAAVWGVKAACPQHTFITLTKRAERLPEWFEWVERESRECNAGVGMSVSSRCFVEAQEYEAFSDLHGRPTTMRSSRAVGAALAGIWPLPNVWLGISAENQDTFDERYPYLVRTPAAVRFFSLEPLLGPIDLIFAFSDLACVRGKTWVIVGCESGPGARDCDPAWIRSIVQQCRNANVPVFLKQARPGRGIEVDYAHKPNEVLSTPYLDGERYVQWPEVACSP